MGIRTPSPLISRALDVAVKRVGMDQLSKRLGVPVSTIETWRLGGLVMPQADFLRLIDLLTTLEVRWSEWNPEQ